MKTGNGDIELAGIVKSYDDGQTYAVNGINLKIPDGAYCCLLGPSGCGKSTILRMIAGHEDPTSGEIVIGGENVVGLAPVERRTAMMFQSYALFPHLSVRDNIAFALRVRGLSRSDRYRKADAMIEKVRLTELRDRLPGQLSGGQQQRVALARAAITEPRVLLLDEPLSALDEHLRIRMRTELRSMQQDLGITFIHVTHTQLEAIALADIVVVMDKGAIRQSGPAREIYSAPRDRYVAEFLGGQNVLSGRIGEINGVRATMNGALFSEVAIPLPAGKRLETGQELDIAIRRDDIELKPLSQKGMLPADSASVEGTVNGIEYQGNFVKVMLQAAGEDEFVAFVPERKFFEENLAIGEKVLAVWQISHTQVMA
ncbi:ABC transporter ATP-binding protein [Labrenzia sp. 011]|uniref:ABC transporter ATP-binding protein n=1 Tax=Labrenzia sp. 011 TaxID=2171494 RepID=UPI000D518F8F|nr:ABC transporter ATP-binding protein [Labrenzia sp. 011]PVB59663.1 Fe3+/spermidine/putrescine ABC transporter ATP-binding protein [Labrenzia sp. 011]